MNRVESRPPPRRDKRVFLSDADLAFVDELVERGLYFNRSEVVKEALKLLRQAMGGEKPESEKVGAAVWDWKVKRLSGGGAPAIGDDVNGRRLSGG